MGYFEATRHGHAAYKEYPGNECLQGKAMDEQVCGRLAYGGSVVVVLSAYGFFLADHGSLGSSVVACGTLCPR